MRLAPFLMDSLRLFRCVIFFPEIVERPSNFTISSSHSSFLCIICVLFPGSVFHSNVLCILSIFILSATTYLDKDIYLLNSCVSIDYTTYSNGSLDPAPLKKLVK